jgi:hypothetical protein
VLVCLLGGLSLTEATGVTNLRATVIRIFTPDGTLIVETDDPAVKVTVEGDGDLVITGAGAQEVRLRPGSYKIQATKDGKSLKLDRDLVTIERGGKQVVRIRLEGEAPSPIASVTITDTMLIGSFTVSVKLPGAKDSIVRKYTIKERLASKADDLGRGKTIRAYPWGSLRVEAKCGPGNKLILKRLSVNVSENWGDIRGESLGFSTVKTDLVDPRLLEGMKLTTAAGEIPLFFDETAGLDVAEITVTGALKIQSTRGMKDESTKTESGAFVLLGAKGVAERKFDTLAEAMQAANSGDTIEVRGNGPFETKPVYIGRQALTIRAASHFHPVIRSRLEDQDVKEPLLSTDGSLVMEGIEWQQLGRGAEHVAAIRGSTAYLANCRFVKKFHTYGCLLHLHFCPKVHVRNCQFVLWEGRLILSEIAGGERLVIENSVLSGANSVCFEVGPRRQVTPTSVELRHSSVAAKAMLVAIVMHPSKDDPPGKLVRMEASEDVFEVDSVVTLQQDERPEIAKVPRGAEAEALLARLLAWRDQRNVYAPRTSFLDWWINWSAVEPHGPKTLEDWYKFWGQPGTDFLQGRVRYSGGNLLSKLHLMPEKVTPEDFRLRSDSAGYRAGKDGKDLGANVDLVGPGPAYERMRKTAEYQQWLKETRQKK